MFEAGFRVIRKKTRIYMVDVIICCPRQDTSIWYIFFDEISRQLSLKKSSFSEKNIFIDWNAAAITIYCETLKSTMMFIMFLLL